MSSKALLCPGHQTMAALSKTAKKNHNSLEKPGRKTLNVLSLNNNKFIIIIIALLV